MVSSAKKQYVKAMAAMTKSAIVKMWFFIAVCIQPLFTHKPASDSRALEEATGGRAQEELMVKGNFWLRGKG